MDNFIFITVIVALFISFTQDFWGSLFNRLFADKKENEKNPLVTYEETLLRLDHAIIEVINKCLKNNKDVLKRKKRNLVFTNEYGAEDHTAFNREMKVYINTIIIPKIEAQLASMDLADYFHEEKRARLNDIIAREISNWIDELPDKKSKKSSRSGAKNLILEPINFEGSDPYEYEGFCRLKFEKYGWKAWQTSAGGDQGADVIAVRGGLKVVVQCKLWSSPVGSKAVQEIVAAKNYYKAHEAVVVSNQTFTAAATRLASANGVLLLHHNDIDENLIFRSQPKRNIRR